MPKVVVGLVEWPCACHPMRQGQCSPGDGGRVGPGLSGTSQCVAHGALAHQVGNAYRDCRRHAHDFCRRGRCLYSLSIVVLPFVLWRVLASLSQNTCGVAVYCILRFV